MTGGKFANGAITAAFAKAYNQQDAANRRVAFRALNKTDRERLNRGLGLSAKDPSGKWEHWVFPSKATKI